MKKVRPIVALVVPLAATLVFAATFDLAVNVWWLNLIWLIGVLCAVVGYLPARGAGPSSFPWRRLWPLLPLLLVVSACWLPFYNDWRWVGGGDSMGWFLIPEQAARHGLALSALSVRGGPFEFFTYTSVIADNALMFLFEPTFFWHRASKLVLSLLALASIYAYFATVWRPYWAVAICIGVATHFMMVWLSFLSFNHIDSFTFGYLTLLATALILRDPRRTWLWAAAGACGGLSLLFTGTAWSDVVGCGAALLVFAVVRRHWEGLYAYAVAGCVAALPVAMQLSDWIQRQMQQSTLGPESDFGFWEHRLRIAGTILMQLPFGPTPDELDPNRYFFFWPAGPLYLAGLGLAALSVVPWARRVLDLPRAAAGLLALFLWSVFLQAMTTGYGWPSWKRSFYLVPVEIFFALLPLAVAAALLRRWRVLHFAAVTLVFAAVTLYGAANIDFLAFPRPRNWGNKMDAFVQVRQRFPARPITIFAPGAEERPYLEDPNSDWNRAYRLHRDFHPAAPLELVGTLDAPLLAALCPSNRVLCFDVTPMNKQLFRNATLGVASQLSKVEVYWNAHLQCFECAQPG